MLGRFTQTIIALIHASLNVEVVEVCLVEPFDLYVSPSDPSQFTKYTPKSDALYYSAQHSALRDHQFEDVPWQFFASVPIHYQGNVVGNLWVASDQQQPCKNSSIAYLQQMTDLIGERLEAEEKYEIDRQRSQLLSQYIEMSVDATTIVDPNFRVLDCNDSCAKLSGLTKEWFIGKSLWEMGLHDSLIEKLEPWKQMIQSVFETGQPQQQSFSFPGDREGRTLEYTTLAIPQLNDRGKAVAVLDVSTIRNWSPPDDQKTWQVTAEKLFHEISSHRETQERLTALNAELEERVAQRTKELVKADKAKSIFLANASHELRTPMNGIIGMADLLCQTNLSAEQREMTSTLMLCAEQMIALVNNILDFSKAEAGRMELDPAPFGVRSLIASVGAMLRETARAKGLDFVVEIDPEVPSTLFGDSVRIVQILTNLASNAIKFTAQGQVRIQVQLTDCPGQVRFVVEDTGIGIAATHIGRLFTAFTQVDSSTTRRYGGTGLGLAISKQLTDLMGGEIAVKSVAGEGSTFWCTLPLMAIEEESIPSLPVTEHRPVIQHLDAKVLVVEDNQVNQMVLLRHLKQIGYTDIDVANNGLQAVAAVEGTNYDAVLMDCQMPEMDGFEATRVIRSMSVNRPTPIPIIAITALSNLDERERCLAAGMDGFLQKPYTRQQLDDILQDFLSRSKETTGSSDVARTDEILS